MEDLKKVAQVQVVEKIQVQTFALSLPDFPLRFPQMPGGYELSPAVVGGTSVQQLH